LVGGNTRYCFGFDAPYSLGLARRVKQMASELGGSVVATNSRRTPPAAWTALTGELSGRHAYLVDWRESQPDFYFALLAEADIFVATGDSLSMCSEVCATGKPLLIDLTLETTEPYHRQILSHLLEYGAARLLNGLFRPWNYVPPDPAGSIAEAIRARLRCPPPA
jgi:hypothetical protein